MRRIALMPIMIRKCFICDKVYGCSYPSGAKFQCPEIPYTCRHICPQDDAKVSSLVCEDCAAKRLKELDKPKSTGW